MIKSFNLYDIPEQTLGTSYGVGVNDLERGIAPASYFVKWHNILERCYGNNPEYRAYKGCSICDEWLLFSNFALWMDEQDHYKKDLDKDILKFGNRLYSPDTCCFVPSALNQLFANKLTGQYMRGTFLVPSGNYVAFGSVNGRRKSLGTYADEFEAHKVYLTNVLERINGWIPLVDEKIGAALLCRVERIEQAIANRTPIREL